MAGWTTRTRDDDAECESEVFAGLTGWAQAVRRLVPAVGHPPPARAAENLTIIHNGRLTVPFLVNRPADVVRQAVSAA